MATDIKLRSVVNENSLKASTTYTPRSTVYVETSNTLGPLEDVTDGTDNQFSINNTAWGSTGVVRIPPSYPLVKLVVLSVDLTHTNTGATVQPGHAPDCTYWLYRLIRNFTYRLGNSDKVTESGDHLPFLVNEMCDTQEKREALLEAAGEGFRVYNTIANVNGDRIQLQGIMPLPWSSPSTWRGPKPIPLYMTNQSLELEIEWEQANNVNNLITCGTSTLTINSASYKIIYEQLGSHNQLKSPPYLFPFQYHQSQVYPVTLAPNTGKTCQYMPYPQNNAAQYNPLSFSFQMLGLRSGETSQFMFRLAPRERVYNGVNTLTVQNYAGNALCPWIGGGTSTKRCVDIYKGVKLSTIEVEFGGQKIYSADTTNCTEIFENYYNWLPPRLPGRKRAITQGNFVRIPGDINLTTAIGASIAPFAAVNANVNDGYGTVYPDVAMPMRSQPIIREPNDIIGRNRGPRCATYTVNNIPSDIYFGNTYTIRGDEPAGFYYHIPVAQLLDHVRNQDYSLGADFEKGELKVTCIVDTDYYRRKGQYPLVLASLAANTLPTGGLYDLSNIIFGRGAADNANNAPWSGYLDPDCSAFADVIDGVKWNAQGTNTNTDYAVYALASTNAIYHFSGQNVTRIS